MAWTRPLGARPGWTLSFGVLLGQRGWFDRFPTRVDASTSTVEVSWAATVAEADRCEAIDRTRLPGVITARPGQWRSLADNGGQV